MDQLVLNYIYSMNKPTGINYIYSMNGPTVRNFCVGTKVDTRSESPNFTAFNGFGGAGSQPSWRIQDTLKVVLG